jgi:hypothetical protein
MTSLFWLVEYKPPKNKKEYITVLNEEINVLCNCLKACREELDQKRAMRHQLINNVILKK